LKGGLRASAVALAGPLALAAALAPAPARARCPSYSRAATADPSSKHHCGVEAVAGKNPSTDDWKAIFALVAQGPKKWGSRGPAIADLKSGCATPKKVPATFPCEVLKAIGQKESNWTQFCAPTEPASEKGKASQTLIAFDCGYGVSQVTSGMSEGGKASFDRERVSSDPVYNLAAGAALLAEKWQGARCIEDRDPGVIEHWYIALWKYNGYSYSNDPSNPIFGSSRGVWNPAVGGAAPYQERVFGIIENGSKGGTLWKPIALAYPRIEDVAGRKPDPVAKIECASPTDCTNRRSTHRSGCDLSEADRLLGGGTGGSAAAGPGTGGRPGTSATGAGGSGVEGAGGAAAPEGGGDTGGGGCGCGAAVAIALTLLAAGAAVVVLLLRRRRGGGGGGGAAPPTAGGPPVGGGGGAAP